MKFELIPFKQTAGQKRRYNTKIYRIKGEKGEYPGAIIKDEKWGVSFNPYNELNENANKDLGILDLEETAALLNVMKELASTE
jgi:hypothetical protein